MHKREPHLLNTGLYTVPEAARLTRISVGKVRRWLKGYDFRSGTSLRHSDAVWQSEIKPIENRLALSFRDLLELRFVDAFIKVGVSWKTMRRAHANAQEELRTTHPFCSQRIATDGKNILLQQAKEDSDAALLNLVTNQREFSRIVHDFLKELEFAGDEIVWWPLGRLLRNRVFRHRSSPAACEQTRLKNSLQGGTKSSRRKSATPSNSRNRSQRRREILLRRQPVHQAGEELTCSRRAQARSCTLKGSVCGKYPR